MYHSEYKTLLVCDGGQSSYEVTKGQSTRALEAQYSKNSKLSALSTEGLFLKVKWVVGLLWPKELNLGR